MNMKRLASICNGVAIFLILGVAVCADGTMDAYGPTVFMVSSLICMAVAYLLIRLGNWAEYQDIKNRPRYRNYRGRRHQRKRQYLHPNYRGEKGKIQDD